MLPLGEVEVNRSGQGSALLLAEGGGWVDAGDAEDGRGGCRDGDGGEGEDDGGESGRGSGVAGYKPTYRYQAGAYL